MNNKEKCEWILTVPDGNWIAVLPHGPQELSVTFQLCAAGLVVKSESEATFAREQPYMNYWKRCSVHARPVVGGVTL